MLHSYITDGLKSATVDVYLQKDNWRMPKIKLYYLSREPVVKHLQHTAVQYGSVKCLETNCKSRSFSIFEG